MGRTIYSDDVCIDLTGFDVERLTTSTYGYELSQVITWFLSDLSGDFDNLDYQAHSIARQWFDYRFGRSN